MENTGSHTSQFKELTTKYSSFVAEIRKRLIFTLIVFLVSMIIGFVYYEKIVRLFLGALELKGVNIVFTSPFQFINLAINCGITTGLVVIFPLLVYQLLSFLKPALKKKEYKMILVFLPFSLILFLLGFSFGFLIMKWQIGIFLSRSVSLGIGNILDITKLLNTIILTSIFMGIGFEFPILLLLLLSVGIIKHQHLSRWRLWVYLGSLIFAVLLPPDSILADILLSLPLIVLFELTLIINKVINRKGEEKSSHPSWIDSKEVEKIVERFH